MAHMTKKKMRERAKNNLRRVCNNMNTGTRNMGYVSNQDRKLASYEQSIKKAHLDDVLFYVSLNRFYLNLSI